MKQLAFLYSPRTAEGGGTVMRGSQLSSMTQKALAGEYLVSYLPLGAPIESSYVFITKMAMYDSSVDYLADLRRRGNILFFDVNDGLIDKQKLDYADSIVVSSAVAHREYCKRYPEKRIALVDHHVDPRIVAAASRCQRPSRFAVGYFGDPSNAILTPEIEKVIDVVHVNVRSQKDLDWIDQIPKYTLHYAIRRTHHYHDFKPATKVFTAAYCAANVLIQESEEEAVSWLGNDYPFILRGEVGEQTILRALESARRNYQSEEWQAGLRRMEEIRGTMTEERVLSQLRGLIEGAPRV